MFQQVVKDLNLPNIRYAPFSQTKPQCFANAAAWLRWFLTADIQQIEKGNFTTQACELLIEYVQKNAAFYDCSSLNYHKDLAVTLAPFSLVLCRHSRTIRRLLTNAINIDACALSSGIGGFIFASSEEPTSENPGHVLAFCLRRHPTSPEEAFFSFFDPNAGSLILSLPHFPRSPVGTHEVLNEFCETRLLIPNKSAYDEAIDTINTLLSSLEAKYTYVNYHVDLTTYKGEFVMFSPLNRRQLITQQPSISNVVPMNKSKTSVL